MPYARPSTATIPQPGLQQQHTDIHSTNNAMPAALTAISPSTLDRTIAVDIKQHQPLPRPPQLIRRIPAPALLPPIQHVDVAIASAIREDLALNEVDTDPASSSLSVQVQRLINRNRTTTAPPIVLTAHHQPDSSIMVSPPVVPSKTTAPANRDFQPQTNNDYQHPATYGPSVSKIRSYGAARPPLAASQPQGLPFGAAPFSYSGFRAFSDPPYAAHKGIHDIVTPSTPRMEGTIARTVAVAKGTASIFLHNGWFDILSVAATPAPGSVAGTQPSYFPPIPPTDNPYRAFTDSPPPVFANANRTSPKPPKGKRVSVDMVSRPMNFTHLVHASDAEQAEAILTRWRVDRDGKLPEPAWARALKDAAVKRARARAVAQVQANLAEEQQKGSLKVVNPDPASSILDAPFPSPRPPGLPLASPLGMEISHMQLSPASSPKSMLDDAIFIHDVPVEPILPAPRFPGLYAPSQTPSFAPTTVIVRDATLLDALKNGQDDPKVSDSPRLPTSPNMSQILSGSRLVNGRLFKPSLETVERSVAAKVYLENHYYGILKRPRDRDQRRAALERELAMVNMTDSQRRAIRAAWLASETEHLRNLRQRVSANSFKKLKTIGHGAFGVVSLVRETESGEVFAMKQLRKADMLRKGQEGHIRAERDILSAASSSANSRWIVKLVYAFQDVDHLYLVTEFLGGGDLLNLLIERDIFPEDFTKFYVAEMILAIHETHRLGYIHRDVKPDNFIFGSDGHIKITDFGLATDLHWAHDGAYFEQQRRHMLHKHGIDIDHGTMRGSAHKRPRQGIDLGDLPILDGTTAADKHVLTWRDKQRRQLAYSVVGTNSYMSPEVIRGSGYDQSCDWWSLGVIMYECLYGFPPFVSKTRHMTRQKILNWRETLRFPSRPRVSREAQDLIQSLLCEREDRLGSRAIAATLNKKVKAELLGDTAAAEAHSAWHDGLEEIQAHPWFNSVNWQSLHLQEAPYQPALANAADTRHFDDDIDDKPLVPAGQQPGDAEYTKDPLLRHKTQGPQLLEVRKQLAFQGYTFKSPKQKIVDSRSGLADIVARLGSDDGVRGRSLQRETSSGFRRAMSV